MGNGGCGDAVPVEVAQARVESIGVNSLDRRRVDVAVDITPCREPLTVEMVIVGPDDAELCSTLVVQSREWAMDRVMHLRRDAAPGVHTLHVGLFYEDRLLHQAAARFAFASAEPGQEG
jgi:hypothetical protein